MTERNVNLSMTMILLLLKVFCKKWTSENQFGVSSKFYFYLKIIVVKL
jgi:hypothetical protein